MKALLAAAPLVLAACATGPRTAPNPRIEPLQAELAAADIVFFGEEHDDRAMHLYERDLLAAIGGRGPTLLGMEMFQRPAQAALDDYVAGRIDEKEMLRRTEYFDRWRADYTLYAPLWRHCREHGVRIVALNPDGAIASKVNRHGLAALSADERAASAEEVDLSVAKHRERIVAMFAKVHPLPPAETQRMYEAMTLWDETMAESAARAFAAAGPDARMLVVAGVGHIDGGDGVPNRFARRAPAARRVIVVGEKNDEPGPVVRFEDGQWVATFPAVEAPPAPKLGVGFDPKPARDGLLIQSIVEGGAAAKAGVKAGDVLARLADAPVTDLVDVRYVVDARRAGDVVDAKLLRDGAVVDARIVLTPPADAAAK